MSVILSADQLNKSLLSYKICGIDLATVGIRLLISAICFKSKHWLSKIMRKWHIAIQEVKAENEKKYDLLNSQHQFNRLFLEQIKVKGLIRTLI